MELYDVRMRREFAESLNFAKVIDLSKKGKYLIKRVKVILHTLNSNITSGFCTLGL